LIPNLAENLKYSPRHLQKLLPKLFGIKPGQLLRALNVFSFTAKLMQNENQLLSKKRRGNSPLGEIEAGYHRRLRRLLGITYTELLQASRNEHWVAVWMRAWRQKAFCKAALQDETTSR